MGGVQSDQPHPSLSAHVQELAAAADQTSQLAQKVATGADSAVSQAKGVYGLVRSHLDSVGGDAGVAGGYFGGDDTEEPAKALKEYRLSLAAASKDRIARGLARALANAGIKVNENASAEEIARDLKNQLPDPRNKKTFASAASVQEEVCRIVAGVLNDEFTPGAQKHHKLIDTSLGAVSVCQQVAEIVHSLSTGLHSEFLEVHASLSRVLTNLELLDELLRNVHDRILSQIQDCDLKLGADKNLASFEDFYVRVQKERERQMSMLRNLLSVSLAPAQEELALAMRDESDAHDMIKRLELVPGTGTFADTLAMAVSGLGTVAVISARVDKALKEVGLGIKEYLDTSDLRNLENILDKKLMSDNKYRDNMGNFLKAVQTLKENFYRRSELDLGDKKASKRQAGGRFWTKTTATASTAGSRSVRRSARSSCPSSSTRPPVSTMRSSRPCKTWAPTSANRRCLLATSSRLSAMPWSVSARAVSGLLTSSWRSSDFTPTPPPANKKRPSWLTCGPSGAFLTKYLV